MDYAEFKRHVSRGLPLNRKERFYTATVLPALLLHNGTANLHRFLRLIRGFPADVDVGATDDAFLFFTEYNLKQSAGARRLGVGLHVGSNETPDVLLYILRPARTLVLIEAKVFGRPEETEFAQQMAAQRRVVIVPLATTLGLDALHVFHVALIPKALGFLDTPEYQVIHWEVFLRPEFDVASNHFHNYLRCALEHYDALVQRRGWTPTTAECKWSGEQAYEAARAGKTFWVGRKGGRTSIETDVHDRTWRQRTYFINTAGKPTHGQPGNWVSGSDFAWIVEGTQTDPAGLCKAGLEALRERLGPAGAIRFLQQFDPGHADYTKDRHAWLDQLSVEEIADSIARRRAPAP